MCNNTHIAGFFMTNLLGVYMKHLVLVVLVASTLVGCGTIGGAVSGAGQDLSRAGEWIKNK
jgi:predicted small secreted protein